ncbi:MAG: hypothetical protein GY708_22895 [Actinomycetia bacterium]|nr:hypothetical protein [Actinomycetes bacterium]
MLDAVQFEDMGLPAAAIVTEPFVTTCRAMAALRGYEEYPMIVVPHPVTSLTLEQVHALADSVTPEIASLLMDGTASGSGSLAATLEEVVEALAPGLRSDGADLTAHQPDDRTVVFELFIPDQACAECVMPSSMLLPMFAARVHAALGPHLDVRLDDPRDSVSS